VTAQQCPQCGSTAETDSGAGCECGTTLPHSMDTPTTNPPAETPGLGTQEVPSQAPEGGTEPEPEAGPATEVQPSQHPGLQADDDTAALPPVPQQDSGPEPTPQAEAENPTALLHPMGAPVTSPSPEDLVLFADDGPAPPPEVSEGYIEPELVDPPQHRRRNRRLTGPVLTAVAVCAVALGAVALGPLASSSGNKDQTLPDDSHLRPTAVLPTGDGTLSTTVPEAPSSTSHPSKTASTDASTSASPSASPSKSKEKSGTSESAPPASAPVLSLGVSGPEVVELQLRLREAHAYKPKADGVYDTDVQSAVARFQRDNGISGDPAGTYGPNTRQVLESQTSEP
jgi:hypothetical protein